MIIRVSSGFKVPSPKGQSLLEVILKGPHVDPAKQERGDTFLSYVRDRYIGTLGGFTSPRELLPSMGEVSAALLNRKDVG